MIMDSPKLTHHLIAAAWAPSHSPYCVRYFLATLAHANKISSIIINGKVDHTIEFSRGHMEIRDTFPRLPLSYLGETYTCPFRLVAPSSSL